MVHQMVSDYTDSLRLIPRRFESVSWHLTVLSCLSSFSAADCHPDPSVAWSPVHVRCHIDLPSRKMDCVSV